MEFSVQLTEDAANDLTEIYEFIASHDGLQRANAWLDRVERVFTQLTDSPNRGSYPKKLIALGIREYRQMHWKPYRVIYRIAGKIVYVFLITDGRRDMRSLLERRLFESN